MSQLWVPQIRHLWAYQALPPPRTSSCCHRRCSSPQFFSHFFSYFSLIPPQFGSCCSLSLQSQGDPPAPKFPRDCRLGNRLFAPKSFRAPNISVTHAGNNAWSGNLTGPSAGVKGIKSCLFGSRSVSSGINPINLTARRVERPLGYEFPPSHPPRKQANKEGSVFTREECSLLPFSPCRQQRRQTDKSRWALFGEIYPQKYQKL